MAAIYGFIDVNAESGSSAKRRLSADKMHAAMEQYATDKTESCFFGKEDAGFFSCAHQFFTRESVNEELPLSDEDIVFTMDGMIDNREEIIEYLSEVCSADIFAGVSGGAQGNLSGNPVSSIPDGKLVYLLYKQVGKDFINRILGIFAIAIYEKKTDRFLLYTDHTGSRCINYIFANGRLVFSTTFGPILNAFPKGTVKVSEKFIINCECNNSPDMITVAGPTLYEGVFQLKAGHYLEIPVKELETFCAASDANHKALSEDDGNIYKLLNEKQWSRYLHCYWNPLKSVKKIKGLSQQEYRKLFLDTFAECVKPLLRSNGNTAATLSSGLDSSAVCCVALPMLAERGEKLYSFTSVPEEDFISEEEEYYLTDESKGPKIMARYFDNLCADFEPCSGKSALTYAEELVSLLEMPIKSAPNLMWLSSIYKKARNEKNCRILLKGQFGNSTISYGEILSLFYQQLLKGKLFAAGKTLKAFMRRRHVPKAAVKHVIREMIKEKLHTDTSVLDNSLVKRDVLKKSGVYSDIKKAMTAQGRSSLMNTDRDHRNFIYSLPMYQHLSMYDTRLSLAYGILPRDPAKDKRIIELCLALPMECFVYDGIERNMVRGYMEGIVPAEIRNDVNHRGSQSADFINRMEKYPEFDKFRSPEGNRLFDTLMKFCGHIFKEEELRKVCEAGKNPKERKEDIQYYAVLYMLGVYLQIYK